MTFSNPQQTWPACDCETETNPGPASANPQTTELTGCPSTIGFPSCQCRSCSDIARLGAEHKPKDAHTYWRRQQGAGNLDKGDPCKLQEQRVSCTISRPPWLSARGTSRVRFSKIQTFVKGCYRCRVHLPAGASTHRRRFSPKDRPARKKFLEPS